MDMNTQNILLSLPEQKIFRIFCYKNYSRVIARQGTSKRNIIFLGLFRR